MYIELKPSEIFYSQDSIRSTFDSGKDIGELLDEIVFESASVHRIPNISVIKCGINGSSERWHTADNRRLWVFKQLERLGFLETIRVIQVTFNSRSHSRKFSTVNGGESIRVRGGGPSGRAYTLPDNYCER